MAIGGESLTFMLIALTRINWINQRKEFSLNSMILIWKNKKFWIL